MPNQWTGESLGNLYFVWKYWQWIPLRKWIIPGQNLQLDFALTFSVWTVPDCKSPRIVSNCLFAFHAWDSKYDKNFLKDSDIPSFYKDILFSFLDLCNSENEQEMVLFNTKEILVDGKTFLRRLGWKGCLHTAWCNQHQWQFFIIWIVPTALWN